MLLKEGISMMDVAITVNGKRRKAQVEPRTLLVHFLRNT
jgi:aerobic-type carbon monoxide dehydrogenase small subunit (CoxS/CutS family)